jgi:hypothetical protein
VAAAESLTARAEGRWPTEKKIVVGSLLGVSAATLGFGFFSYLRLQAALSEHNGDFPHAEGRAGVIIDCLTPEQCARLRESRREVDAWSERGMYAIAIGSVVAVGAIATAYLWPNGRARIEPAAASHGATLSLRGTF